MSTKQKRINQQKQRERKQAKALDLIRGKLKRPNMTDKEALFYQRALQSKETPLEHLEATRKSVYTLLDTFHIITDMNADSEVMGLMASVDPELKTSIENATAFITASKANADDIYQAHYDEFAAIDPKDKFAMLVGIDALEEFEVVINDIDQNAHNLMLITKDITTLYLNAEKMCGDEQNV